MKENNITLGTLLKTNEIINSMESHSFHNHFHILYDICDLFKSNISYLEIGCFAGGSASLVSTHPLVRKVYSIDLGKPIDKSIPIRNVNKFKNSDCEYSYIQGDSTNPEIIKKVFDEIKKVDILFIDGDHRYEGVISDFNNYKNIVNQGGYIIFDDYLDFIHSPEVKPAVDDIVKKLPLTSYEIYGSIKYDFIDRTNIPSFNSSNLFVIKKI